MLLHFTLGNKRIFVDDQTSSDPRVSPHAWCYFRHFGFHVTKLSSGYSNQDATMEPPYGFIAETQQDPFVGMFGKYFGMGVSWVDVSDMDVELPELILSDSDTTPDQCYITESFGWIGIYSRDGEKMLVCVSGIHEKLLEEADDEEWSEGKMEALLEHAKENRERLLDVGKPVNHAWLEHAVRVNNVLEYVSWMSREVKIDLETKNVSIEKREKYTNVIYNGNLGEETWACRCFKQPRTRRSRAQYRL